MILIKNIYKLLLIIISFFIYDLETIDSNSDKIVLYDIVNIHDENIFKIYFKRRINLYDINNILKNYNIDILSYIINDKEYYAKDERDLIDKWTLNKNLEEKIYYQTKGIYLDGLKIRCENNELIKLSRVEKIY